MHLSLSPYAHAEHAASVAAMLAATKPTPATPFEFSIRAARRHGAPVLTTSNDSLNAPMLAVNHKLGFVPLRGNYLLGKAMPE